ncbi:MAG: hypothetical protein ACRECH_08765 [Nitrososphaerales archaeon]
MEIGSSKNEDTDLNAKEIEVVMKALGHYQIHLFDELSKADVDRIELQTQSELSTASIKKLHRLQEKMTGIKHAQRKGQNP